MKIILFCSLVLLTTVLFISDISGQNTVTPGTVRADATFENISINYTISGDLNRDSKLIIRYRVVGAANYADAAMTMRAYPGLVIDGNTTTRNFHAGSILFLDPGTTYDLELDLTDPDGGGTITSLTVTTKTIPQLSSTANILYVSPGNGGGNGTQSAPYLGLQAAADNAQPGDHFIVAAGSYSPCTILNSGTMSDPISFISEIQHQAIIEGTSTDRGIITLGDFNTGVSHILIDGFTIKNGEWGIDAQNTEFITVRNNIIQAVDYGYVNRRENGNEKDQYITNNLILGNTAWPQSGIPGERGIDIRGNNNVVSYNTIKNFGDGISTDGPPYELSYSLDIHNNDIQNIPDDLIEVDGIISNARVYANRCFNGRAGVSLAPIYGGPAYVMRNVFFNLENSAFKMNRGPSGIVAIHNTSISSEKVFESPTGWQNSYFRNNVFLSSRYCFEFQGLVSGSLDDWDFGAYFSTRTGGSGTEWFKWNNVRYAQITDLQNSALLEANAIAITIADFENANLPTSYPIEYTASQRNLSPVQNSAVTDNGVTLVHMNNRFVTDGQPDRGALEYGEIVPRYGHIWEISSHVVMTDNCIEIFPNPFIDKVVLTGDFTNFDIQIFSSTGQLVTDLTGTSAPITIDLTTLGSGIYFLNVTSTLHNHLNVYKIIKE